MQAHCDGAKLSIEV